MEFITAKQNEYKNNRNNSKLNKEKRGGKFINELRNSFKYPHICITGIPEKKIGRNRTKYLSK